MRRYLSVAGLGAVLGAALLIAALRVSEHFDAHLVAF